MFCIRNQNGLFGFLMAKSIKVTSVMQSIFEVDGTASPVQPAV